MDERKKDILAVIITKDDIVAHYESVREDIAQTAIQNVTKKIKKMMDKMVARNDDKIISGDEVYEMAKDEVKKVFLSAFKDYFKEKTKQNKAEYIYIDNRLLEDHDFPEHAYLETIEGYGDIEQKVAEESLYDSAKLSMYDNEILQYLSEVEDEIRKEIDNEFADIQANIKEKVKTDNLTDENIDKIISDIIYQKFNKIINEKFKPVLLKERHYGSKKDYIDIDSFSLIPTPNAFLNILEPNFQQYHRSIKYDVVEKIIQGIKRGEDSGVSPSL